MKQLLIYILLIPIISSCNTSDIKNTTKKTFYPDGSIKSITNYKNEHKNGKEENYYSEGSIYSIKNYLNDSLDGEQIWFYLNGFVEQKKVFKNGIPDGHWYCFYPSGALKNFRYLINGHAVSGVDYWDDSIGIIQSSLHFNASGQIYYKKNFDRFGNLIGQEGKHD